MKASIDVTRRVHGRFAFDSAAWATQVRIPAQRYPAGVRLFEQGTSCEEVLWLRQGLVKLFRTQPSGEEVIVGLRASGWLLGAAAAIQEDAYAASAATLIPSSISRLGARPFRVLLHKEPTFSWGVHRMHSREVYAQVCQLGDLGALSARQRLENLLQDLAPVLTTPTRHHTPVEIPLKHWEIAQLLAITPPYLSRLFRVLEREGLLVRASGKLSIVKQSQDVR